MIVTPAARLDPPLAPPLVPLTTSVSVSLASEEKTQLSAAAKKSGLSMSAFSRQAILSALGGA